VRLILQLILRYAIVRYVHWHPAHYTTDVLPDLKAR